jgi:Icc-related predicted phosphoesterase
MESEIEGKILICTDIHGLIPQMNQFFHWIIEEKKEKIALVVCLGDFFKGRNFDGKEKTRHSFEDLSFFDQLKLPVFHIKGNEDLDIPEEWYLSQKMWLMKDQEPFSLNKYKVLPLHYQNRGEYGDEVPKHPEFNENDHFDLIFSHRPPLGILDHTLHHETHRRLSSTGSPLIRNYLDKLKPSVLFFGHFHYSNYQIYEGTMVVCIDKLIRIGFRSNCKYSYALLDPSDDSLDVYWKNRLFLKYSIPQRKILFEKQMDHRDFLSE